MNGNERYLDRINRVIDHLGASLDESWSLDELAAIACFSPYHFHRIFKSLTGETVHEFAKRLRVEKAARLVTASRLSMTAIAGECGFDSPADFTRSFKAHFGVAPSRFTRGDWLKRHGGSDLSREIRLVGLQEAEAPKNTTVEVVRVPSKLVAYVRIFGAYDVDRFLAGYNTLLDWSRAQGVLKQGKMLGMSQDDPDITPMEKYRYDFCITVPEGTRATGGVSVKRLPAHLSARLACRGNIQEVARAWDWLYKQWLPGSDWQPDDAPCVEEYATSPVELGWEHFDLNLHVPIRRL